MLSIKHQLPIEASVENVFSMIATADGLNKWWTLHSSGHFKNGQEITLDFGPGYEWKAKITDFKENKLIEYTLIDCMEDWKETRVGIELIADEKQTILKFYHSDWKEESDHFQSTSYCWAVYLRLIKKFLETGATVDYPYRLEV